MVHRHIHRARNLKHRGFDLAWAGPIDDSGSADWSITPVMGPPDAGLALEIDEIEWRGTVHRIAAVGFIFLVIWHTVFLFASRRGRFFLKDWGTKSHAVARGAPRDEKIFVEPVILNAHLHAGR